MEIFAFILAILAFACFVVSYIQGRAIVSLGLALLTAAWIVQLIHPAADVVIH